MAVIVALESHSPTSFDEVVNDNVAAGLPPPPPPAPAAAIARAAIPIPAFSKAVSLGGGTLEANIDTSNVL